MTEELLPAVVLRQIGDKLYEKRKLGALEVEQIVKRLAQQNDYHRIRLIIDKLIAEYAFSTQANNRKGALLCLAASAVALNEPSEAHLRQVVPPVLASFTDPDARVRYYACEALYNIAKVARNPFISFFNEAFDAMFRLCADSDPSVQNALQFLDSLVKDIVAAHPTQFNISAFIPKLRDYMRVTHPAKRHFLVNWIMVLDSVPDLDMLSYLPEVLEGLMSFLSDPNREIRVAAHKAMTEFLSEINATRSADFSGMASTLVAQAGSHDEFTRLTALKWIKTFVELAAPTLAAQYPSLLSVVLPNISHPSREIAELAKQTNDALLTLAPSPPSAPPKGKASKVPPVTLDTHAILATVSAELIRAGAAGPVLDGTPSLLATQGGAAGGSTSAGALGGTGSGQQGAGAPGTSAVSTGVGAQQVLGGSEASRLEALRWVHLLLGRAREQVLEALPALMPALLDALVAQSESVAEGSLGVFAAVARCPGQFRPCMTALLDRFRGEGGVLMLQRGGALVIRRLCAALGSEAVLVELAGALDQEQDLGYASTLVQALSLILLTSPEVRDVKETLRGAAVAPDGSSSSNPSASGQASGSSPSQVSGPGPSLPGHPPLSPRGPALFAALYPSWAHAPGALLGLCLLAQAYDHAYDIIQCYRWLPIGAEVLVQIDRLVQLLDTPGYTFLRLQLLQPQQHAPLLRALYALLMLLPQSNAFRSLSTRLNAVPTHALLQLEGISPTPPTSVPAAAAAASAPFLTPSDWALPSSTLATLGGPPQGQGTSSGSQNQASGAVGSSLPSAAAAVRWQDIDLAALLKLFCARQQRHYLRELGQAATQRAGGSAAMAAQEAAAAAAEAEVVSALKKVQLPDKAGRGTSSLHGQAVGAETQDRGTKKGDALIDAGSKQTSTDA